MPVHQYTCNNCEKIFESNKKNKKFCGSKCYYKSKKKTIIIKCKYCQKKREMAYRFRAQQYCSKACSNSKTKSKHNETLLCKNCSNEYVVKPSRKDTSKFCSYDCFLSNKRCGLGAILVKHCKGCNEEFETTYVRRAKQFCSRVCAVSGEFNAMTGKFGELSPMYGKVAWNNGLTAETDERVKTLGRKISAQMKEKFKSGTLSNKGKSNPNFGRTRDTRTQVQLDNYSKAAIKRLRSSAAGFITGKYFSHKMDIEMRHRSSYEKRMMICLDRDENIISYDYETITIRYSANRNRRYLVDFDVEHIDGRKLIEVKAVGLLDDPVVMLKENAAKKYCENRNATYEIYTLKEIKEYENRLGIRNED